MGLFFYALSRPLILACKFDYPHQYGSKNKKGEKYEEKYVLACFDRDVARVCVAGGGSSPVTQQPVTTGTASVIVVPAGQTLQTLTLRPIYYYKPVGMEVSGNDTTIPPSVHHHYAMLPLPAAVSGVPGPLSAINNMLVPSNVPTALIPKVMLQIVVTSQSGTEVSSPMLVLPRSTVNIVYSIWNITLAGSPSLNDPKNVVVPALLSSGTFTSILKVGYHYIAYVANEDVLEEVQFEYQTSAMKKGKKYLEGTKTSDPNTYVINITNI